jgi:hypothetical protein
MKALCRPHWFWVKGFILSQFVGCPLTMPWSSCCYWVVGFELPFVSPGYGFVHATDGCAVGYIALSRLCFISALLVG